MGPEEVRARQLLLDMMDLLSRDPYEALGLIPSATAADIKHAFHAKTKVFHPARFARMSPDIQRLANEVFLSLRAVHDSLARPTVKVPAQAKSGAAPMVGQRAAGTGATPAMRPTPQPPPSAATTRPGTGQSPALQRPGSAQPAQPAQPVQPARPAQPSAQPAPATRPGVGQPQRPGAAPQAQSQPSRQPAQPMRPLDPLRPGTTPGVRIADPRLPDTDRGPRLATPSPQPTANRPGGVVPPSRPSPMPTRSATGQPAEPELAAIYILFEHSQFAAAQSALETMIARAPNAPKYQALLAYTKGKQALLDGRQNDARVELQDALQLDPDLQLAKTALAELFRARR